MNNRINEVDMVSFVKEKIEGIIKEIGKINLVFPPYKLTKGELVESYHAFASGLARKNLAGYDNLSQKNKKIVELYELASAFREKADEVLKEVKVLKQKNQHGNFLMAASIL